jgi:hypothetical protein
MGQLPLNPPLLLNVLYVTDCNMYCKLRLLVALQQYNRESINNPNSEVCETTGVRNFINKVNNYHSINQAMS